MNKFRNWMASAAAVVALTTMPAAVHADVGDYMDCGAPWNPYGIDFSPCASGPVLYQVPADFCDWFGCIPSFWESTRGYAVMCGDWEFSHSGGRRGACSRNGGESAELHAP